MRVVFNQKGEVLARNDYYPFGKQHDNPALTAATTSGTSGTSTNPADNRYLYNGKEKQLTGGLGFLDYGARMSDPEIVRWHNPDQLAEASKSISPYAFTSNDPINKLDPDGNLDDWYLNLASGRVEHYKGNEDRFGQGYIDIGKDNASIEDIHDALTQKGFKFAWVKDGESPKHLQVDTESAYKGWQMMQIFSPENVGTILGLATAGGVNTRAERGAVTKAAANYVGKSAAKTGLTPLGLGSTGRTVAANVSEQLAIKEAMSNPLAGQIIPNMKPLTDLRWLGWSKMQYIHTGLDGSKTIIHYNGQWVNGVLKAVDDFKFK